MCAVLLGVAKHNNPGSGLLGVTLPRIAAVASPIGHGLVLSLLPYPAAELL
jgi:hypothetical protein